MKVVAVLVPSTGSTDSMLLTSDVALALLPLPLLEEMNEEAEGMS
jgi:hypothetical protein